MTNPPRQRGTAAETAVTRWLRDHGFPHADRQPLRGGRDQGDIDITAGLIAEVKNHRGSPGVGQPAPATLAEWLRQAETERINARADHCLLIVKRTGTADPGRWWVYLTLADLLDLAGMPDRHPASGPERWICTTLESAAALMAAAGYGRADDKDGAA